MSHFDLTDPQGNRYRLDRGSRIPLTDSIATHHAQADWLLSRVDSFQLGQARAHFYHLGQFPLLDSWRQERLDGGVAPLCPREELAQALCNHELILVSLGSGEQQGEEEDRRAILRIRIRQALAAIIAQEKVEAAQHTQMLAGETQFNRALIYTGAFFNGLWNAGVDLAQWAKEVSDVISPTQRLLRSLQASHRALQRNRENDENVFAAYADEQLKGEKRELVQALGFDPTAITTEQLDQAMEVADLIWDDPTLRADITRFAKDYVSAQHAIELTEVSGGAAFEVLFTLVLAAVTAGAGLAVGAASQARHLAKFRKVGDLLVEFAEQIRKVRQRLRRSSAKGNGPSRSFGDFTVEDVTDVKEVNPGRTNHAKPSSKPESSKPTSRTEIPKRERPEPDSWKTYKTHGINNLPMQTPQGRAVVESYRSQGTDLETAVGYAEQLIKSGSTLPEKITIRKGQKLYKIVPEGTMPGDHSAYFATQKDIDLLEGLSYDEISDQLGIPLESQQTDKFDIVEVEALQDIDVFQSKIAPTTQCGYSQPGGATQTLITNRNAFSAPKTTGIKRP
ncbi:hypothetical protein [Microbulbifer taiwanensis]|uniref:LysM domain-containing protein n=1 Tax=Microbulbifer taiwanensis TaxID=986746 RepID=A0ABW1YJV2_9GAMM|nr:hypothetical protein [Microbulbifer taiwanensis]